MSHLVSVNLRRPWKIIEGDDAWMEPRDLIDFDGWECFADSGAIYHTLHEALRVTEATIRSKHRSSVLHHQSVGRVFNAITHKRDGLIHHGCDLHPSPVACAWPPIAHAKHPGPWLRQ